MDNGLFLTNNSDVTFLEKVKESLSKCKSFKFSVSFIKKYGLDLLIEDIDKALSSGVEGKLITSTYQNFTDIPSLSIFFELQERYDNFECHLEWGSFGTDGFHTKGYIFEYDDHYEIIIGSSNITRFALLYNKEWDISVCDKKDSNLINSILNEFDYYWQKTRPLTRDIIKEYATKLEYAIVSWDMDYLGYDEDRRKFKPNDMQRKALLELSRQRNRGAERCLVVAATGSGKTYLAAFDAFNFDAQKLLFIVHKDVVLGEALKSFRNVFGNKKTYGLYTGKYKELSADFLFATNYMLSKNLTLFAKDEFDYIIIDEVHHAAAATYQKIINYFKPKFLLGLTATPDRMDQKDIYDLFGNNVPFDLRLREAIENDLVVPFHYYGIKDRLVDYEDDYSEEGIRKYISQLSSKLHCEFVDEQIKKYAPEGKLKCIGFCKNVEHARLMALGMEEIGYHTTYITANDSMGMRQHKFDDLQRDDCPLEIIFAVDVLNEGVDIPAINMVLFLRPTESSVIFLQQLGRGLRKYKDKEYLIVLDFIGNSYKRSVQIALALGSLSKSGVIDKRTMADNVRTGYTSLAIPGVLIELDEESQTEILKSIENTNFNELRFLKQEYDNFKSLLRKSNAIGPNDYPMHTHFLDQSAGADILKYIKKYGSYYNFLMKVERNSADCSLPYFNVDEKNALETLSWFLPLVRKEEYLILKCLVDESLSYDDLFSKVGTDKETFEFALDMVMKNNLVGALPESFIPLVKFENNLYSLTADMNIEQFKDWYVDLLTYGLEKYDLDNYTKVGSLNLYGRYSGPNALMALNYRSKDGKAIVNRREGIYYVNNQLCLFIDLKKDAKKEERLKYQDYFKSRKVLHWESQTNTSIDSGKAKRLIESGKAHLFVRKAAKEDGTNMPFVYIGKGSLTNPVASTTNTTVLFDIELDNEIPEIYKYEFGIEDVD